ncbi:hypothetical protein LPMP_100500 [Leishmania panamensis]|uniref:Uncharacterized protein n=1 Tax=Leishmania panamensis TaxID=5679 RepID=A0A088RLQ6_LEIPA|nr:hypothetical protein LPMP_100500 [Leishmania panamensis]AIN96119.1 hypothetical protein LPMP_100500 [Leishmania panamensis]
MPPLPRLCLGVLWIVFAVGSCACTVAEGKPRPPYTKPVIQTSHDDAFNPESSARESVLPVDFNTIVADPFLTPATLLEGTRSTGKAIAPEHIFTNPTLRLVFDVPNTGLDFVINFTSAKHPLIQDPNGTLWRSVLPSKIEVVKQNTKYTYNVGNLSLKSYRSQSESVQVVAGAPAADAECYSSKACCAVNSSYYSKYELVDSPVPPYVCTGAPVPYSLRHFTFNVHSTAKFREASAVASCEVKANPWGEASVTCTASSSVVMGGVTASPPYRLPSRAYSLCRQGDSLANPESVSSPFPVVLVSFCPERHCIGYTPANYRSDRGACINYPLGFYTSARGNNTNQFSSFEEDAAGLWPYFFNGCKWIDDVTMSSTTIQDISFQCDVPESTGWSLSYENFSAHLTDTIAPLFPIGRPTRVSGQYANPTDKDTILFEVEYVSFSRFKAGRWTFRICAATQCATPTFPVAGDTGHYPNVMRVSVSASKLGLSTSPYEPTVIIEVYSAITPTTSPFRTLLAPSVVHVEKAVTLSSQDTVNMTLARDPPERVLSPYAASTSGKTTSRVLCEGDYRFSTLTNNCQPLTDKDCATKYRGRRSKFDSATKACAYSVPPLNGPLVFKSLAEPEPPRLYSPEELRAILKTVKLPQFLRTMEKSYEEYERQAARRAGRPVRLPPGRAAAAEDTDVAAAGAADEPAMKYMKEPSMPGSRGLTIACITATCLLWTVALLRDVLFKFFAVGPWDGLRPCAGLAGAVGCWHRLGGACARARREEQPQARNAASNTTATPMTARLPTSPNRTQSGQRGGRPNFAPKTQKGNGATFMAGTPLPFTTKAPHAAPRESATSAPLQSKDPTPPLQREKRGGGKKGRRPRAQRSRNAEQEHPPNVPAGVKRPASLWGGPRPYVSTGFHPGHHAFGFPEAPHVPFGREAGVAASAGVPFMGGDYAGQSAVFPDEGVGTGPVPVAFSRPHSASSQRWYSSPPSGWRPFENVCSPLQSPRYAPYDAPLSEFGLNPPSTSLDGLGAFVPASFARQSSRVEVLSSDTDERTR